MPKDLNLASLRVHAVDMIYELDLSPEQLAALRITCEGAASGQLRTPATGDAKLRTAFEDFYRALLTHADDEDIAKARNHLMDLATSDDTHLDDEVVPTATAEEKAVTFSRQLSAGQIAAYLASHADQISDPSEKMVAMLSELHDADATDADELVKTLGSEAALLIGGSNSASAQSISTAVSAWIKNNKSLNDDQLAAQHNALLASAKKALGDPPPMDILSHWMDDEIARLISNPQLPQAIAAVLEAHADEH